MPPEGEGVPFQSSVASNFPSYKGEKLITTECFLKDKQKEDGAEGLWRVHDELYDLTDFVDRHPGGKYWLQITKNTDVTEAFESFHISTLAEEMLPNFYVRKAKTPRKYNYTFEENGFYKTLKRRVREILKTVPKKSTEKVIFFTDLLLIGYITLALLSAIFQNIILGAISGIFLALLTIAAHNFFHKKDNFRMFYFDFSLMSSQEWRISHALSHHMYPNTVYDLEVTQLEPFLIYFPQEKHILRRIIMWIISPGFYVFLFIGNYVKRFFAIFKYPEAKIYPGKAIFPLLVPLFMCLVGKSVLISLLLWGWIIVVGSFYFGLIGLAAAHHHPDIFHDGDAPRKDRDWGLAQMDAVMDRPEINKSLFLILTSFGDHALHHLFPTLDHGVLHDLYPALFETCKEFGIEFRLKSQMELIWGQLLQLMRVRPNPIPPGEKKKNTNNGKKKTWMGYFKPYINVPKEEVESKTNGYHKVKKPL